MKRTLPFVFLFFSCAPGDRQDNAADTTKLDPLAERVLKSTYADGTIKSEVPYKNGMKNGVARSYTPDGSLSLELPYVNNLREGTSKKYYTGGKVLAQTTEYKGDKFHGVQTRYRGNGNVMSEARYENDFPCAGLREYLENQSLKKKYPTIEIKVDDKLKSTGVYKLNISLSEKVRSVKFYEGRLTASGCMSDDVKNLLYDEATRSGQVSWYLPPGSFMMEELNIIAVFETLMGNTAIIQRKYHLAIDNK